MSGVCDGRVAIVTGAGSGLGRCYAQALAEAGAAVVANDINEATAHQVVEEIIAAGGRAIANNSDITDFADASNIVDCAVNNFGQLDVVVNNAGVCRDRMFASMSEQEWDQVVSVHLKGHFCISRHAVDYWRARAKRGEKNEARIINTSSGAGLNGSIGQSNYAAAKAGIAALTLNQAAELFRYGITANALAPSARTGMTEEVFADMMKKPEDGSFDHFAPENVAPLVVWLASSASGIVNGRVFEVEGGQISLADGWRSTQSIDKGARWEPRELTAVVEQLLESNPAPQPVYGA